MMRTPRYALFCHVLSSAGVYRLTLPLPHTACKSCMSNMPCNSMSKYASVCSRLQHSTPLMWLRLICDLSTNCHPCSCIAINHNKVGAVVVQSTAYSYNYVSWTGGADAYQTCDLSDRASTYVGTCTTSGFITYNTTLTTDTTDTSLTDVTYTCSDGSSSATCAAEADQLDWCNGLCYCGTTNCTSTEVTTPTLSIGLNIMRGTLPWLASELQTVPC